MQGKSRMTLLDVQAIVKELKNKILGMRVANIYNLSNRTFQFKLKPASAAVRDAQRLDEDDSSAKIYLLMESGIRVHLTKYERQKEQMPSAFSMKLRKHLRGKRLTSVSQMGVDRVVDFKFGIGENANHVILELHSGGNVILTDHSHKIVLLLRRHTYDVDAAQSDNTAVEKEESNDGDDGKSTATQKAAGQTKREKRKAHEAHDHKSGGGGGGGGVRVAVGELYPIQLATSSNVDPKDVDIDKMMQQLWTDDMERHSKYEPTAHKKSFQLTLLRTGLAILLNVGQNIVEHCLVECGLRSKATLKDMGWNGESETCALSEEFRSKFLLSYRECCELLHKAAVEDLPGYIECKAAASLKRNVVSKKKKLSKAERRRLREEQAKRERDANLKNERAQQLESVRKTDDVLEIGDESEKQPQQPQVVAAATTVDKEQTDKTTNEETEVASSASELEQTMLFVGFTPFLLAHNRAAISQGSKFVEYPTFNEAVDEYFSLKEQQRDEVRRLKHKAVALEKVERVKHEHQNRVSHLEKAVATNETRAQLIELNIDAVQRVIDSLNEELARGADWREIELLVNEHKAEGNPVASLIVSMNLAKGVATLRLSQRGVNFDNDEEEEDDDDDDDTMDVDVHIDQSAFLNAQRYYQAKKVTKIKATKTEQASAKAVRAAERSTERTLKDADLSVRLQKMRKVHWFEKFHWFISSENYLVIGGRDAQQNETLVRRYMKPHDIYVHGDFHGASSVVVKNPFVDQEVPPKTLIQAVTMCVCRSSAWTSKVASAGYWVYAHQVSKTAPTGEYLTTGSFMVRGTRNYIEHTPLALGVAMLFRVDESCVQFHVGERRCRTVGMDDDDDDGSAPIDSSKEPSHDKSKPVIDDASLFAGSAITSQFVAPQVTNNTTNESIIEEMSKARSTENYNKGRAKMSRAERRRLKKYGTLDETAAVSPPQKQQQQQQQQQHEQPQRPPTKKLSKAKRKKLKKLAKKYADQDEEEWELVSKLLGVNVSSTDGATITDESGVARNEDAHKDEQASGEKDLSEHVCYHCRKLGHLFANCPERQQSASQQQQQQGVTAHNTSTMSFAQAKKATKVAEEQDLRQFMQEENLAVLQDERELSELDHFTGKPLTNDTILYPIVMCAPVSAINDYKYKAKIVPGSSKRGKVAKAVVDMFIHQTECTPMERDLIKSVPDQQFADVLLSKLKLSVPSSKHRKGGGVDKGKKRKSKKVKGGKR